MSFDVTRARRETPGCEAVIHFNNAGASLMPIPVLDSIIQHLRLEAEIGGYEAHDRQLDAIERFYGSVAAMLGCAPDEIAYVENATRAWDMAFYSIPFQPGDRILTARAEYASNYIAFLQAARRTGVTVEAVPSDETGAISIEALRSAIDDRVKLIAITHVPTNGGLVNRAAEVGRVARDAGILYLLDACQSAGQMPLDVSAIGCDMLSATGRKFLRGPRGTGFLYVRKPLIEKLEPPFLDLHSAEWIATGEYQIRGDARRFENWEQYYAGKIGLAVAIDYALQWGLESIRDRVYSLAELLRKELSGIPGIVVRDLGDERCGIVTFTAEQRSAIEIKRDLSSKKINVVVSPFASTLLDMRSRNLTDLVRASVHYFNTNEEISLFCNALRAILK